MMKALQVALVAAAGVAAAVPGMSVLGRLGVPGSAEVLFQFVLAAFSAAVVLIIYAARARVARLSTRAVVAISAAGMVGLLLLFAAWVWLTHEVLIVHHWRNEPATQFVPLFLSDSAEALIRQAGSRYDLIMKMGPDIVLEFTTETNVALTMMVLLVVYAMLVTCLAGVFAVLGLRAMAGAAADSSEAKPMEGGLES